MFRQLAALPLLLCAACSTTVPTPTTPTARLPLLTGWFEDQRVFYVTTDVSDALVAAEKGANYAPALGTAIQQTGGIAPAADNVYAVTNFEQASIFASAPYPAGSKNRSSAYTPLWRLSKVTWLKSAMARTLRSEEAVLAAADSGEVKVDKTSIVLNCPIVHLGSRGGLPGVTIDGAE